ncbi:unnamed protein product [Parnassius apollo]|uniref:(apollo) hypothetical protein n=1 Tax=Parnassius apollo TaxID=110799 RepID=A0A8S3YC18_PARAO|nr:unnamed protein product [Parnassius apollo]
MEVPVAEALPGKGKKRKRQPEKWKANKAKTGHSFMPPDRAKKLKVYVTIIPSGIEVNPLKLRDVRNLLQKHYGDSWKDLAHLRYFHAVLNTLDEDELRLLEERGVEEENDTVREKMNNAENSKEVQADFPDSNYEETQEKIRPLEKVKLYPKAPIEPSAYGKGKNYSRPWILQDGRKISMQGSEMRDCFKIPKKPNFGEGIRKRMLTNFFWEQMLDEVIEELATSQPTSEFCTEYDTHYVKDQFEPRSLEVTADKNGEILEKFRRCQYFTKPMEERLDDGWVL